MPTHVPDHVVDVEQAGRASHQVLSDDTEAGKKWPQVAAPLHKSVNRIAVSANAREDRCTLLIRDDVRLFHADGATRGGFIPGLARIVDPEGNHAHRVSVQVNVLGDGMVAAQRRGQHEANLALLHNVRGAIALAGFRSCVSDQPHAEGGAVKIRRLARVAHVELHVVSPFQGQKIHVSEKRGSGGSQDLLGS